MYFVSSWRFFRAIFYKYSIFWEMYIYHAIYSLYREIKVSSEIKPYQKQISVVAVSDLKTNKTCS